MVTHDLRMVQFADRVLQMRDGKLVNVYENPEQIIELARGSERTRNKMIPEFVQ